MNKLTGFLEMGLIFGGVLGVLIWQLVSLKKSERDEKSKKDSGASR